MLHQVPNEMKNQNAYDHRERYEPKVKNRSGRRFMIHERYGSISL